MWRCTESFSILRLNLFSYPKFSFYSVVYTNYSPSVNFTRKLSPTFAQLKSTFVYRTTNNLLFECSRSTGYGKHTTRVKTTNKFFLRSLSYHESSTYKTTNHTDYSFRFERFDDKNRQPKHKTRLLDK